MSAKAEVLAKRIAGTKEQFTRIRGFVANGNLEPKFCATVCARLLSKISLDSLRRSGGDLKESRLLYENLKLWALKTDPEVEAKRTGTAREDDDEVAETREIRNLVGRPSTEALAQLGRAASGIQAAHILRIGGEALILNGPSASLLVENKVCAYCLAAELLNTQATDIDLSQERQGEVLSHEAVSQLIKAGSAGAGLAMARAHNREMHALNGNIHLIHTASAPRTDVIATAVNRASLPVKHRHVTRQPEVSRQRGIQEEVPMLTYGMTTSAGVSLVNVPPTKHQLYWYMGTLADELPDEEAPPVGGGGNIDTARPPDEPTPGTSGLAGGAREADANCLNLTLSPRTRAAVEDPGAVVACPGAAGGSSTPRVGCQMEAIHEGRGEAVVCARSTASTRGAALIAQWRGALGVPQPVRRRREMGQILNSMHGISQPTVGGYEQRGLGPILEALADEDDTACRDLTWIGIGEDPNFNTGQLTLTTMGAEVERLNDDPTSKDGRVNSTYTQYVWRYLASSPLLSSVLSTGAQVGCADLAAHLIKLRLCTTPPYGGVAISKRAGSGFDSSTVSSDSFIINTLQSN